MFFGGRVTPIEKALNAHRRGIGNQRAAHLALNPADPVFVRDNG
jgi:hypothetical protein